MKGKSASSWNLSLPTLCLFVWWRFWLLFATSLNPPTTFTPAGCRQVGHGLPLMWPWWHVGWPPMHVKDSGLLMGSTSILSTYQSKVGTMSIIEATIRCHAHHHVLLPRILWVRINGNVRQWLEVTYPIIKSFVCCLFILLAGFCPHTDSLKNLKHLQTK